MPEEHSRTMASSTCHCYKSLRNTFHKWPLRDQQPELFAGQACQDIHYAKDQNCIAPVQGHYGHANASHEDARQLIRAAADPVFSLSCSSIKFTPGVRTQLALTVAGKSTMVSIQGWNPPKNDVRRPLADITAKQATIIDLRLYFLDTRIYSIGPEIIPIAFIAK